MKQNMRLIDLIQLEFGCRQQKEKKCNLKL